MTILDDNNYGSKNENSTLALIRKYWMLYHLIFMTGVTWGAELLHQLYGFRFLPIDKPMFQIWLVLICSNSILLAHFVGKQSWLVSVTTTLLGLILTGLALGFTLDALSLSSMGVKGTAYMVRHAFFYLAPTVVFGGFIYISSRSNNKSTT